MVSVTLGALILLVVASAPVIVPSRLEHFTPFFPDPSVDGAIRALLHGTALMFVAYTGYGRIATLGEEVRDPVRTIPRAIIVPWPW